MNQRVKHFGRQITSGDLIETVVQAFCGDPGAGRLMADFQEMAR
jgi:hypothetical protein